MSKHLTKRAEDYSKWYNELIVKADMAENSAVRGCMVIKPYACIFRTMLHKNAPLLGGALERCFQL